MRALRRTPHCTSDEPYAINRTYGCILLGFHRRLPLRILHCRPCVKGGCGHGTRHSFILPGRCACLYPDSSNISQFSEEARIASQMIWTTHLCAVRSEMLWYNTIDHFRRRFTIQDNAIMPLTCVSYTLIFEIETRITRRYGDL